MCYVYASKLLGLSYCVTVTATVTSSSMRDLPDGPVTTPLARLDVSGSVPSMMRPVRESYDIFRFGWIAWIMKVFESVHTRLPTRVCPTTLTTTLHI